LKAKKQTRGAWEAADCVYIFVWRGGGREDKRMKHRVNLKACRCCAIRQIDLVSLRAAAMR